MAEQELREYGRVSGGVGGTLAGQRVSEKSVGGVGSERQGGGADDHFRAVAVREDRAADRPRRRRDVGRVARLADDAVGYRREQGLLVLDMPVQGARLHAECGREATHRQVGQAELVEEAERAVDDLLEVVGAAIRHAHDYTERRSMNGVQEGVT